MNDLRLRDALRPLADAINPRSSMDAIRTVRESFKHDGTVESRALSTSVSLSRLDWLIEASHAVGDHPYRYFMPEHMKASRISLVSDGSAAGAFSVSLMVNDVSQAAVAIRTGTSSGHGTVNIDIPSGSVLSIVINSSISQAVTASIFYRAAEE